MTVPNQFIVYVSDAPASARFYGDLFDLKPSFETPGFITFDLGGGFMFSVWRQGSYDVAAVEHRTSEVCLSIPGAPESVDRIFEEWKAKGAKVVAEPSDQVFGRTFIVADPDGNLIRVAPLD